MMLFRIVTLPFPSRDRVRYCYFCGNSATVLADFTPHSCSPESVLCCADCLEAGASAIRAVVVQRQEAAVGAVEPDDKPTP